MSFSAGGSVTRVLIANSQAVIRLGLRLALEEQSDMHVVAEACDAASAFAAAAVARPDIAVVELDLPGSTPIELARTFLSRPGLRLVALDGSSDPKVAAAVIALGVRAVLDKNARTAYLVDAIRAVRDDRSWLPPQPLERPGKPTHSQESDDWVDLTPRERAVAELVVQGLAYREVAARLDISDHTVKNHLRRIYDKLDINSRVELAVHGASREPS